MEEALAYYLQDLKLTRSEVGVNHPTVARILGTIGMVYDDKNDKLAGELYEGSLAMLLDTYGSAHVDVATVRSVHNHTTRVRQNIEDWKMLCSTV